MMVVTIRVEHAHVAAVQCEQNTDARQHDRPAAFSRPHQGLNRSLPLIVAVDIDTSGSDRGLVRPAIEALHARDCRPSDYLVDGGFTKKDDIEWAHATCTTVWCPPGHTKHGTDPYAPRPGDSVAVAEWRKRMASDLGKKTYRLRAEHECINAHGRRMGLRQLPVRGKDKARTVLLWFALAHNMMCSFRLRAAAQVPA